MGFGGSAKVIHISKMVLSIVKFGGQRQTGRKPQAVLSLQWPRGCPFNNAPEVIVAVASSAVGCHNPRLLYAQRPLAVQFLTCSPEAISETLLKISRFPDII